jgi:hypothetical protein
MNHLIAVITIILAGCSPYGVSTKAAGTDAAAVRARLGEPEHLYQHDGKEIWEYTYGPFGYYGYHYEFDANLKLERSLQTRTEQNAARVHLHSATGEDVKAIIGWPVHERHVRGRTYWEWPMINYVGIPARLVVQFADDGTVDFVGTFTLPLRSTRWR